MYFLRCKQSKIMHEYGITESILNIVLDKLEDKTLPSVKKINLTVGKYSGFSTESIEFYFDILKKDTALEKAELHFILKEIILECPACKNRFQSDKVFSKCSQCGYEEKFNIISGKEFFIESVEIDDQEEIK